MHILSAHVIGHIILSVAPILSNARPLYPRSDVDLKRISSQHQRPALPLVARDRAQSEEVDVGETALAALAAQLEGTLVRLRARLEPQPTPATADRSVTGSVPKTFQRRSSRSTSHSPRELPVVSDLLDGLHVGELLDKVPVVGDLTKKLPIVGNLLSGKKANSTSAAMPVDAAAKAAMASTDLPNVRRELPLVGGLVGDLVGELPIVNKVVDTLPIVNKVLGKSSKPSSSDAAIANAVEAPPSDLEARSDQEDDTRDSTASSSSGPAVTSTESVAPTTTPPAAARSPIGRREDFDMISPAFAWASRAAFQRGGKRRSLGNEALDELHMEQFLDKVLDGTAGGLRA